jgi:hypothetical protein
MRHLALCSFLVLAACDIEGEVPSATLDALPETQVGPPINEGFTLRVFGPAGSISTVVPGDPIEFLVRCVGVCPDSPPTNIVRIAAVVGGTAGPGICPGPLGGACLNITGGNTTLLPFTIVPDPSGLGSFTGVLPATIPSGTTIAFQAVDPVNIVASEPWVVVTP